MYRHLAAFALLSSATAAHAESTPVSGRVLNEMVAGSTVVIDAPMGYKLPIRHGDDGTIAGEAGGLAFYLGSSTDTGRWWVADDRLCYKWSKWFKSETRCMRVRRDGSRIEWEKEDGDKGTGTLTLRQTPLPAKPQTASAERAPIRIINAQAAPAPQPSAAPQPEPIEAAPRAIPQRNAPPVAATASRPEAARAIDAAGAARRPAPSEPRTTPNIQIAQAGIVGGGQPLPAAQSNPRVGPAPSPPFRVGGPPMPPQGSYRVVSVAADDVLYVRVGPSKEHPSIGSIAPEARGVRMAGPCQGDWCLVRHLGVVGWVHSYYLQPSPGLAGPSIPRVPAER